MTFTNVSMNYGQMLLIKCAVISPVLMILGKCSKQYDTSRKVKNLNSIGVHDNSGCLIASDERKASVVRDYLEKQLTGDEQPLEPFEGVPRPLNLPFTGDEIHAATKSLKNGRADGPDGIPNELIKY